MKHLIGLIMSFAIGARVFAQDNNTTAKFGQEKSIVPNDVNIEEGEINTGRVSFQEERFENGSVYYVDDPNPKEGISGSVSAPDNMNMPPEKSDKISTSSGTISTQEITKEKSTVFPQVIPKGSPQNFGTPCTLNNILNSREGEFKLKGKDEDLKIEREKSGEAIIKYDSDTEYYKYKENEKGESEYTYILNTDDEAVEVIRNKDGSGDVYYQGHFDNLDDAKVFEEGLMLKNTEGAEAVCK